MGKGGGGFPNGRAVLQPYVWGGGSYGQNVTLCLQHIRSDLIAEGPIALRSLGA